MSRTKIEGKVIAVCVVMNIYVHICTCVYLMHIVYVTVLWCTSEGEETVEKSSSVLAALEREKLMAEVRERKRKMLREVEVR